MSLYCNVWQYTRVSSVFRSRNSETSGLWMYHYVMILAGNCRLFLLFRLMCNSWSANVPVSDFQQLPLLFGTFSTQFMQFDFSHARIQKCYVLLFTCLEIWKFFWWQSNSCKKQLVLRRIRHFRSSCSIFRFSVNLFAQVEVM